MSFEIKYPVILNTNFEIQDQNGNILCRSVIDKETGKELAELINYDWGAQSSNWIEGWKDAKKSGVVKSEPVVPDGQGVESSVAEPVVEKPVVDEKIEVKGSEGVVPIERKSKKERKAEFKRNVSLRMKEYWRKRRENGRMVSVEK